jgi:putative cardiolipin synthase
LLLPSGEGGYFARAALAMLAERTLDAQYYIWESDITGRLLARRVLEAADRGVRVRLLLDDLNLGGRDAVVAMIDRHPKIEVRLFNPSGTRSAPSLNFLTDFGRLNRRMHNKVFIADNAAAIIGGRNVGDDYFEIDNATNFRDLDLLMAGPIVEETSRSFDQFWNSPWAVPVAALIEDEAAPAEREDTGESLTAAIPGLAGSTYRLEVTEERVAAALAKAPDDLIWAPAELYFDAPERAAGSPVREVSEGLRLALAEVEQELLIENAYFIPGDAGVATADALEERGVKVRVLTNALATNSAPAHAGYARYRDDLLRHGVELYELRPDARSTRPDWPLITVESLAGVHTKAAVLDREAVFLGSFNLDPRSRDLNTEIAVLIASPPLAEHVAEYMDTGVQPDTSYRLELQERESGGEQIVWLTDMEGEDKRYTTEPGAGVWRRFSAWFISLLPIENLL